VNVSQIPWSRSKLPVYLHHNQLKTRIMKTQLFAISLLAVSVLSGGYSANAQKKNAPMADFEKSNRKFIEWFNAGKMDSLSYLYLEATCMIPDNLPAINNRENVKDYYQELFDRF